MAVFPTWQRRIDQFQVDGLAGLVLESIGPREAKRHRAFGDQSVAFERGPAVVEWRFSKHRGTRGLGLDVREHPPFWSIHRRPLGNWFLAVRPLDDTKSRCVPVSYKLGAVMKLNILSDLHLSQ